MNLEHPIVTNGDGDALFPNYFMEECYVSCCAVVAVSDVLDVIVEDPKTQTVDVGANVRFYCRTITAPVRLDSHLIQAIYLRR